ncbi:MAG: hypothetical protein OEY79_03560 [Anaplasmataceae bacterium]|nr:hypothetical protein [Anaplasmataceae bacterium]
MINVVYIIFLLVSILSGCVNFEKNHYGYIDKNNNIIVHKGDSLEKIVKTLGIPDDSKVDNNGNLILYYISLSTKNDIIKYNYSFEADALIIYLKNEIVTNIEPVKNTARGKKH